MTAELRNLIRSRGPAERQRIMRIQRTIALPDRDRRRRENRAKVARQPEAVIAGVVADFLAFGYRREIAKKYGITTKVVRKILDANTTQEQRQHVELKHHCRREIKRKRLERDRLAGN